MPQLLKQDFDIDVSEAKVHRLMQLKGLQASIRQRRKAKPTAGRLTIQAELPNILNRQFFAEKPKHRFVTDVTYIPYKEHGEIKWGYLSFVQDLFDRSIVAWVFSRKQDLQLGLSTLALLKKHGVEPGAILHSDRGSIYTSTAFKETAQMIGLEQSFSRAGNCHDNATMESFNGTYKVEALYNPLHQQSECLTFVEQNRCIEAYIDFYNNKRPCSVTGNMAPVEYRLHYYESHRNDGEETDIERVKSLSQFNGGAPLCGEEAVHLRKDLTRY